MHSTNLNYMPGENDVVCGSRRAYHFHRGNQFFYRLIEMTMVEYGAVSRNEKSEIITRIVCFIRNRSPTGGFVQKDPLSKKFIEVDDHQAVSVDIDF
jgi:hypothetical protein